MNDGIREAPRSFSGIVKSLGPGFIAAAAVVGSGELIATTKTGAVAGFTLLWLILVGCISKIFMQVEFGRFTISSGLGALEQLNQVPGPRTRTNWILWFWLAMFAASLGQLGGIVHGVGQAMSIAFPITGDYNALLDAQRNQTVVKAGEQTWDEILWAGMVTAVTIGLLVNGKYKIIEVASTVLVGMFTFMTLFCLVGLQFTDWAISPGEIKEGFSFRLPTVLQGVLSSPVTVALATFGIIGMSTTDLIAYPYWCLEKGYAYHTGPREQSESWERRAKSWLRILKLDAFACAFLYTLSTVAFYLLGAAVLHPQGLDPADSQMIPVLSQMYVPVFGDFAKYVFLLGAFAVLFSTFLCAIGGHARVCADAARLFGLSSGEPESRRRWVQFFCVAFPLTAFVCMLFFKAPVQLILAAGFMQALMLPMMATAALYARYCLVDRRLHPGKLWDIALWISTILLVIVGGWIGIDKFRASFLN